MPIPLINGETEAPTNGAKSGKKKKAPRRLVLCFDGTGNEFSGTSSDTNIIKLYQMCDRSTKYQYHYYQPGIGTYTTGEGSSLEPGLWGRFKNSLAIAIDQAIGTTFEHHVVAGYRFLMRYYGKDDQIYLFGFSRGAFTARFLSRMISSVGLLPKGNEEMVPFAFRTYWQYEQNAAKDMKKHIFFMNQFKSAFGRPHVDIHFMGLFDCVNSVGFFELPFRKQTRLPLTVPSAKHIRHAVSIDERRLKFKPALFNQDHIDDNNDQDIKEVWFAGHHGDIGGGWPQGRAPSQLSDVALEWMIAEVNALPVEDGAEPLAWRRDEESMYGQFGDVMSTFRNAAVQACVHDSLAFDWRHWTSIPRTAAWWILELVPLFKRLELSRRTKQWEAVYLPPNCGDTRDLPPGAVLHPSVVERMKSDAGYNPTNDGFAEALEHFREHGSHGTGLEACTSDSHTGNGTLRQRA